MIAMVGIEIEVVSQYDLPFLAECLQVWSLLQRVDGMVLNRLTQEPTRPRSWPWW
jgi:hypothetical protein